MRTRLSIPLAALLSLSTACGAKGGDKVNNNPGACGEAVNHSDLLFLQTEIFTPSCSDFTACHEGDASAARGLNLEEEATEAQFLAKLTVPSGVMIDYFPDELPTLDVVKPGFPDESYLVVLMEGTPANLIATDDEDVLIQMPYDNPLLCAEKTQAVRRWIASLPAGAAN